MLKSYLCVGGGGCVRVREKVHEGEPASGAFLGWLAGFKVTSGIRHGLLSRPAWTKDISNFISGEGIHIRKEHPGLKEGLALVLV